MSAAALVAVMAARLLASQGPGNVATAEHNAPAVLRVGPHGDVPHIADAARAVPSGAVVEIEAGDYVDDVASWRQDHLVIRAIGGPVRVVSRGASAEGKALWVVHGDDVVIEGITFSGARVPDRNGAGIRHEGGRLTVRDCVFEHNETGLLTWNDPGAELTVEASEFRDNRVAEPAGSRIGHQIYVGTIARFTVRDSYVHRGAVGHLVKSRARESYVFYNRLTDEKAGSASYELEFPNGGAAYVVGNVIQQGPHTQNRTVVSYGAEGYRWANNALYLAHNTLVDDTARGGRFLFIRPGAARARVVANLLVGRGSLDAGAGAEVVGNVRAASGDLAAPENGDYRVRATSPLAGSAVEAGTVNGIALRPARQYVHPRSSVDVGPGPATPGALQSLAP